MGPAPRRVGTDNSSIQLLNHSHHDTPQSPQVVANSNGLPLPVLPDLNLRSDLVVETTSNWATHTT